MVTLHGTEHGTRGVIVGHSELSYMQCRFLRSIDSQHMVWCDVQVKQRKDWRCPACRGICNCSSSTCQRKARGLCDTGQLWHEARNLGYKSVR